MVSKAAGLGLVMVGFLVVGLGFFAGGTGGGGTPERICDLAGTVTGHVHDDNAFKYITISDINLSATNCRDKGIFDFNVAQAALLTTGTAKISVKAVDVSGDVVRDVQFTITTAAGQIDKDFTQNIKIPSLIQGDSYSIQISAPDWEGGQIKFTEQVTV